MVAAAVIVSALLGAPTLAQQASGISGEVINLDEVEAGKITIKHAPIPDVGIKEDGTVSDFRPKERALFSTVKAGDKVRFSVERVNGELTITKIDRQ
jgi:Cu/Ag efflux protein CusF